MSDIKLRYFKISPEVSHPNFGTSMSACFDLEFSPTAEYVNGYDSYNGSFYRKLNFDKSVDILPMERILIPTGLIFCCSDDENVSGDINTYSIRLYARSGMALKRGLTLVNSVGIVDVDYQEEVFVPLINLSRQNQVIKHKERICQAEIVQNVRFSAVESLHKLERLSERIGGFGSTGS